jgi:serine/threonine protein kinase
MKIKIKRKLKEMSSVTGGSAQGHAAPFGSQKGVDTFNEKEKQEQRLKGDKLEEMYSSRGLSGNNSKKLVSPEDEHEGHVERSKHQGLQNVMEIEDTAEIIRDTEDQEPNQDDIPTVLSKFGNALQNFPKKAIVAAQDAGFRFVGYLGGGQFGQVFKVENKETGVEHALKIVMGTPNSVNREVRNYELVQKARTKSDTLAKHFPETFASWQQDGFGFIVMEILEPVPDAAAAMTVDRYHILSIDSKDELYSKEIEAGSDKYDDYKDQSKKAELWYENRFVDELRGTSQFFEDKALESLRVTKDLDFSDELMSISSAAMLGIKGSYESKNPNFDDLLEQTQRAFARMARTKRLLEIVLSENEEAPYVAVALGKIGIAVVKMRVKARRSMGMGRPDYPEFDRIVFPLLLRYVKGYREYSNMRSGYDKKGQQVATGTEKEFWDKIVRELFDATGLAARDVHYGNVMQRPSGDLVIVDLGLFKMKGDSAGLFESKKYKIKILR